jgi:hypothetical protein
MHVRNVARCVRPCYLRTIGEKRDRELYVILVASRKILIKKRHQDSWSGHQKDLFVKERVTRCWLDFFFVFVRKEKNRWIIGTFWYRCMHADAQGVIS